jgi:hypothetical protein
MSLDLPTENWSLHFNSHAYVERDSIIRHNTIIHNLISTHTQTNWSKRANSVRPYEKIIIAAGDTLIPHSSLLIPHSSFLTFQGSPYILFISAEFPPSAERTYKGFSICTKGFPPFLPSTRISHGGHSGFL